MRKFALLAAVAAAAVATPAAAEDEGGEVRAEVRGGVIWVEDFSEATLGAAVGYDFDLGETAFAGVELSGDKILVDGADVLVGTTARLGLKVGDDGKLFATGGYNFTLTDDGGDAWHLGAGYHHKLGDSLYLGAEYRHYFDDFVDADAVNAVVGLTF